MEAMVGRQVERKMGIESYKINEDEGEEMGLFKIDKCCTKVRFIRR